MNELKSLVDVMLHGVAVIPPPPSVKTIHAAEKVCVEDRRKVALEYLADGPACASDLGIELGVSTDQAKKLLLRMEEEGLLRSELGLYKFEDKHGKQSGTRARMYRLLDFVPPDNLNGRLAYHADMAGKKGNKDLEQTLREASRRLYG